MLNAPRNTIDLVISSYHQYTSLLFSINTVVSPSSLQLVHIAIRYRLPGVSSSL